MGNSAHCSWVNHQKSDNLLYQRQCIKWGHTVILEGCLGSDLDILQCRGGLWMSAGQWDRKSKWSWQVLLNLCPSLPWLGHALTLPGLEIIFLHTVGILLLSLSEPWVLAVWWDISLHEITAVGFFLSPLCTLLILKKDLGWFSFVTSSLGLLKLLNFIPILLIFFAGLFDWYSSLTSL